MRPLTAPATGHEYAFRCTTAGTSGSEPTWPVNDGDTVTTGGATFTNVSGKSTYGWSAAAGSLYSISAFGPDGGRTLVGDRIFLSSDHSESFSGSLTYAFNNTNVAFGLIEIISVNRAGSVPPVAGDITSGAAITITVAGTQATTLDAYCDMFWQGITFTHAGTPAGTHWVLNSNASKAHYFKNCAFVFNTSAAESLTNNNPARVIFDNTTVQFGTTTSYIGATSGVGPFDLTWINTPSAIQGSTLPTALFSAVQASSSMLVTCRGVDLSAITGTLVSVAATSIIKALLDSCRIASGATRMGTISSGTAAGYDLEFINCYDGTNTINERYTEVGSLTTDRTTYLNSGAADDIGNYSLKLVSSSRSDFATLPFNCFWLSVENTVTGSSKTATVEIISSGTLNNVDIRLLLEYMGTSGNPIASFVDSLATQLTASSALPSSSNTWNSPPSTPQKQLLQVTFTPQRAGHVRGLVRLGKVSTTVWVNPQIAIA